MTAPRRALADDDARRTAIAVHDRSFLVEAGAGSGKTAIMAGRIGRHARRRRGAQVHRRGDVH